jgi:YHS domain-containing protein
MYSGTVQQYTVQNISASWVYSYAGPAFFFAEPDPTFQFGMDPDPDFVSLYTQFYHNGTS